jgi:tetratricopeptide (TPR) repeat protein
MEAPESAPPVAVRESRQKVAVASEPGESEQAFEQRATQRQELLAASPEFQGALPTGHDDQIPTGPREAIETYKKILENYPNYERNDQVLYQMSRAYDEIGQPDEAMLVMDRFITEYKYSKYVDEVHFRRGEYFFVRKKYRDAEEAYAPILQLGAESSYYELALYKLGWTLYKQDMYEEALHNFIAMLDFRKSIGFDFDAPLDQKDEHRVTDTFRVVSLSFSNLGGPEVIDDYFADRGRRSYADKIYGNLGEFYFEKLRYDDAASVYKSFIRLNEFHKASPHFSMRVIDIYTEAGFPQLVVESKKDFSIKYSLDADYWSHFDSSSSEDVVGFLKANLTYLENHYHALYQDENLAYERPDSFDEAQRWYREFLKSFPKD